MGNNFVEELTTIVNNKQKQKQDAAREHDLMLEESRKKHFLEDLGILCQNTGKQWEVYDLRNQLVICDKVILCRTVLDPQYFHRNFIDSAIPYYWFVYRVNDINSRYDYNCGSCQEIRIEKIAEEVVKLIKDG